MNTYKTYRKHTAADIVNSAAAKPQWTTGGNLIAEMPDGDFAFSFCTPNESNGYAQRILLLNCMSIRVDQPFGSGVACLEISDDECERLEGLTEKMFDDLNA